VVPNGSLGPPWGPLRGQAPQMTEKSAESRRKSPESRRKSPQRGPQIDPKIGKKVDGICKRIFEAVLSSPCGAFRAIGRAWGPFLTISGHLWVHFGVYFGVVSRK
jgi:hypothetical protein